MDNVRYPKYGCCSGTKYTRKGNCCENGQVVSKVPIWQTTFPIFQSDYGRDLAAGWDAICPLSAFGWNPAHVVLCTDGPYSGCIGVNDVKGVVEDQDYMIEAGAHGKWAEVRTKKIMICPSAKTKLTNSIGDPYDHSYITNTCHHWADQNGGTIW